MVTGNYPLTSTVDKEFFFFQSEGPNGIFEKVVWFQKNPGEEQVFNLALCVLRDGQAEDDVETNNDDFIKTMYTVAKAMYEFLETYPGARIQIGANEKRRLRIYNNIFNRKLDEIKTFLHVEGVKDGQKEPLQSGNFYEWFEISLRME